MKTILTMLAAVTLLATGRAQTNATTDTNQSMPLEITLGGGGFTVPHTGETQFGIDAGISVQPFSKPIWLNLNQELTWQPSLAGSTDIGADWSWRLYKEKLYLNTGWSGGAIYDRHTLGWRSGPEASFEWYTKGNAFFFAGLNYDLFSKADQHTGWHTADPASQLRFSVGIGWAR